MLIEVWKHELKLLLAGIVTKRIVNKTKNKTLREETQS